MRGSEAAAGVGGVRDGGQRGAGAAVDVHRGVRAPRGAARGGVNENSIVEI